MFYAGVLLLLRKTKVIMKNIIMNEVSFQVYVFFFFILEMFMLVKRYVTATAPVMSNDVVFCPQQSKNKTYSWGGVEQSTTLVAGLSLG